MRLALPAAVGAVAAVAAFGGVMVLSDGDEPAPPPNGRASEPVAVGATGLAVFGRMGCGNCHRLAAANATGQIGPSLDERLTSHTARSLKAFIVSPGTGSMMPSDFAKRMSDAELDALVSFLLATRR